jgi:uncharacterized membrane protein YesL
MREFFSMDGAFYKYGGLVADMMIVSILWMFFSLPLVTMGAATTALFYVTTRRISEREGYITRDFWLAFKSNFKKATIIWLMLAAIVLLLLSYILFNVEAYAELMGSVYFILYPVWIILLVELLFISVYLFPLAARFDMGVKQIIKSAFFMGNRHLLTSITCVALGVGVILGVLMYPIFVFIAMGAYGWLASYLIMRIFKRYRPEMDKDPRLEIQEYERERERKRREEEFGTGESKAETETPPDTENRTETE